MTRMVDDVLSQEHRRELVSTPEWNSVCAKQHNVVFEGPERETEGLLQLLEPHLQAPAVWKRAPMPLELQTDECGTLVVQEVAALGRHEQAALLKWLDGPGDSEDRWSPRPLSRCFRCWPVGCLTKRCITV